MKKFTIIDGHCITNQEELVFYQRGIPRRFWRLKDHELRFGNLKIMKENLSAAVQRQHLQAAIVEPARQLIVLGSVPSDEAALAAAFWVLHTVVSRSVVDPRRYASYRTAVVDAQNAKLREQDRDHPRFLLFHNILDRCSDARAERVRDWLVTFRNSVRLVVVASNNPYTFCTQRLGLMPSGCCLLRDVL